VTRPTPDQLSRIVETTFRVRFAETDQMGVVHHAAYLIYLEEGRSELGRQFGASYADFERAGYSLAVVELNVRYVDAARYDEWLTVRTWVEHLQSRSLTYGYEIAHADSSQALVTARTKHFCIDRAGRCVASQNRGRRSCGARRGWATRL
jgi:acyl-CoA thioester hydrolase